MLIIHIALWLGISTLYIGFAGIMGILLPYLWKPSAQRNGRLLALAYGCFIYLPASLFIVNVPESAWWVRLLTICAGSLVLALAMLQPAWAPPEIWEWSFGRRYFSLAMAFAALWGIGLALLGSLSSSLLIGIAAALASTASYRSAPL